jgi:glycosyltransferase involved in cell wall biosynthesis/organic radical activating enzyme
VGLKNDQLDFRVVHSTSGVDSPFWTIIVPFHNSSKYLSDLASSLRSSAKDLSSLEVVLIDDASTDNSLDKTVSLFSTFPNVLIATHSSQSGPGLARNYGITQAKGKYIIFVDSDDYLIEHALDTLSEHVTEDLDLLAFNWAATNEPNVSRQFRRRDSDYLDFLDTRIRRYVRHQMDGSVIFTAFRKTFVNDTQLTFSNGLHEDIAFIFEAYIKAKQVVYLDKVIYRRRFHDQQITANISPSQIRDYFRAWQKIVELTKHPYLKRLDLTEDLVIGVVGVVASRLREAVRCSKDRNSMGLCFLEVKEALLESGLHKLFNPQILPEHTTYSRIAKLFDSKILNTTRFGTVELDALVDLIEELDGRTWSCKDIQGSIFLAPKEVRTCCKRFFVNEKIRGDVVLENLTIREGAPIEASGVLEAKRKLVRSINQGDPSPCDKCPFMRFDKWPKLSQAKFDYISLEHHSVCNLRCTYCDETYFGGDQSSYDVSATLQLFATEDRVSKNALFIWGGGEPIIDRSFEDLLESVLETHTGSQHRFLSNAVRYSETVSNLLREGRAQVVTSVDAGSESVFLDVRGRQGFFTVLDNLKKYAGANERRVTIKYILTEENIADSELSSFVKSISEFDLLGCYFQISANFKTLVLNDQVTSAALRLFDLLVQAGARFVYVDDLLRIRFIKRASRSMDIFLGFESYARPVDYGPITVWGAGQIGRLLLEDEGFRARWKVKFLIDSTPNLQGKKIGGIEVRPETELLNSDGPILLAAVQDIPGMFDSLAVKNIDERRVIRHLVL